MIIKLPQVLISIKGLKLDYNGPINISKINVQAVDSNGDSLGLFLGELSLVKNGLDFKLNGKYEYSTELNLTRLDISTDYYIKDGDNLKLFVQDESKIVLSSNDSDLIAPKTKNYIRCPYKNFFLLSTTDESKDDKQYLSPYLVDLLTLENLNTEFIYDGLFFIVTESLNTDVTLKVKIYGEYPLIENEYYYSREDLIDTEKDFILLDNLTYKFSVNKNKIEEISYDTISNIMCYHPEWGDCLFDFKLSCPNYVYEGELVNEDGKGVYLYEYNETSHKYEKINKSPFKSKDDFLVKMVPVDNTYNKDLIKTNTNSFKPLFTKCNTEGLLDNSKLTAENIVNGCIYNLSAKILDNKDDFITMFAKSGKSKEWDYCNGDLNANSIYGENFLIFPDNKNTPCIYLGNMVKSNSYLKSPSTFKVGDSVTSKKDVNDIKYLNFVLRYLSYFKGSQLICNYLPRVQDASSIYHSEIIYSLNDNSVFPFLNTKLNIKQNYKSVIYLYPYLDLICTISDIFKNSVLENTLFYMLLTKYSDSLNNINTITYQFNADEDIKVLRTARGGYKYYDTGITAKQSEEIKLSNIQSGRSIDSFYVHPNALEVITFIIIKQTAELINKFQGSNFCEHQNYAKKIISEIHYKNKEKGSNIGYYISSDKDLIFNKVSFREHNLEINQNSSIHEIIDYSEWNNIKIIFDEYLYGLMDDTELMWYKGSIDISDLNYYHLISVKNINFLLDIGSRYYNNSQITGLPIIYCNNKNITSIGDFFVININYDGIEDVFVCYNGLRKKLYNGRAVIWIGRHYLLQDPIELLFDNINMCNYLRNYGVYKLTNLEDLGLSEIIQNYKDNLDDDIEIITPKFTTDGSIDWENYYTQNKIFFSAIMPTSFCYQEDKEHCYCYELEYEFRYLPENAYSILAANYDLNNVLYNNKGRQEPWIDTSKMRLSDYGINILLTNDD